MLKNQSPHPFAFSFSHVIVAGVGIILTIGFVGFELATRTVTKAYMSAPQAPECPNTSTEQKPEPPVRSDA